MWCPVWKSRDSVLKTSPTRPGATSAPAPPRHRIADDEVVARNVREAAEIDAVGETVATGRKALVAAGRDGECVGDRDRLRRPLPQLDQHAVERDAMRLHLHG